MPAIDLSQLPPPTIVEQLSYADALLAITSDLLTRDPTLAPVLALASEPLTKAVQVFAYRETNLRAEFNARAQGALLAYAAGANLDNLVVNLAVERAAGESDAALRTRSLLAPDGWSTAGPVKAYVFHALSADASIADVAVSSPAPGQVRIAVLSTAGAASPELLAIVDEAVSADDVRPLTDQVTVVSATTTPYAVEALLIVGSGPDSSTVVAAAQAAVTAYAAAQRRLGRKIARNAVIGALMQPGVIDLVLTSPAADVPAAPENAPVLSDLALTSTTAP